MKSKFEGSANQPILIDVLKEHTIIAGNENLAEEIATIGELIDVNTGINLVKQHDEDNDIYLVISGSFDIWINGRLVAKRGVRDHIGEMAAVQPTQKRAATATATTDSVVCKLTERQFAELAQKYPQLWRYIAKELASRLEQRNAHVTIRRSKANVFIISSVEALEIARSVQNALAHGNIKPQLWTDNVFNPSDFTLDSLEKALDTADFAIAIANPDDVTQSRGHSDATPRDNVILELGLFMGHVGRKRTFLIAPRGRNVKFPSDLLGYTPLYYDLEEGDNIATSLAPACNQIRSIIVDLGPI